MGRAHIYISQGNIIGTKGKKNGRLGTKNITLTKSQLALIFARVCFKMADAENQKRYCMETFSLKTRSTVVFCSLYNTPRLKKYHES